MINHLEMSMSSLFVDKFYVASSEFEEIVFGHQLRDGMIVLIEGSLLRADMDNLRSSYDRDRANECNRWCEVTNLQAIGPLVTFVAKYPDGTMRVRTYSASHAWIVKRVTSDKPAALPAATADPPW